MHGCENGAEACVPAGLVGAQHDDMAAGKAAVLVELGKEAGAQVGVEVDNE